MWQASRWRKQVALCIVMMLAGIAHGADWPQWRGPNLNGSTAATGLPDTLDPAKNLRWSTDLPGASASTPIVSGTRVFLSTLDSASKKLLAMCLDRDTGHILWQREVGVGFVASDRNNLSSPSPVTDGKSVYFYFGTGDLVAFDVAGTLLWSHNIQKENSPFSVEWLYASSPLLYRGKLYIQVLHRSDDSYLLALDAGSGKQLWKHIRANQAVEESKESYATPISAEIGGRSEIVLIGGDVVTAHDSETGEELWRCGGWDASKHPDWRVITSVTVAGDLIIACPPKGGSVFAIKDGGHGDVTNTAVAWRDKNATTDVCVPLFYEGNLYVLNGDRSKTLTCIDPRTGENKWSGSLGGKSVFRASPTGADGKIFCLNEAGETWVLATDQFKVISKTTLGAPPARSTIVVAGDSIFVRTGAKIMAFRGK